MEKKDVDNKNTKYKMYQHQHSNSKIFLLHGILTKGQRYTLIRILFSLVQEAGRSDALLLVIEGNAVITAVSESHSVHVEPPALCVVLVHLGTAHLQLQTRREHSLHSLLNSVLTPVSGKHRQDYLLSRTG